MDNDLQVRRHAHDRCTVLAGAAADAVEGSTDWLEGDRVIALVYGVDGRAGICLHGYASDLDDEGGEDERNSRAATEAAADLFLSLARMFEASGKQLSLLDEEGATIL